MAEPLLRHQSSLESTLDFGKTSLLSSSERVEASLAFVEIVNYCDSYELSLPPVRRRPYNRGRLLQLVYQHAISDRGQDSVLIYFLTIISESLEESISCVLAKLAGFEHKSKQEKDQTAQTVQKLADRLVDFFFLPCEFI